MRLDFEVLTKLCGGRAMSNGMVTVITTRWSPALLHEGCAKQSELIRDLWSGVDGAGPCPSVERVADKGMVKQLLEDKFLPRFLDGDSSQTLNIQYEIVSLRRALDETDAGCCFNAASLKSEKHRPPKSSSLANSKQTRAHTASKAAKLDPQDPVLQHACSSDIVIP
jgi:hypothetical protein